MYSKTRQDHAILLFVNAKVLPLTFLYYESVLNLMHDIDERNAPVNILNLFQGHQIHITIFYTLINFTKFLHKLSSVGAKICNEIPNSLKKKNQSRPSEKRTFKRALLNILERYCQ